LSASLNDRPNKVTVVDESVTVTAGAGVQGAQGDPGIVISGTEPDETDVLWADTSAAGSMVVPAGGTSGQVLAKASGDDYDTEWAAPAARVINTDGDPGYTIYVGSVDPDVSYTPAVGDVWIEPSA
jgi:hypothetical protein